MEFWIGFLLLVLGAAVWLFGDRLWLLGAGAGALLGIGLLNRFPGLADAFVGLLVVVGLAVLLGALGMMGKAFTKMIALVVGFVAGGAVVIGFLDVLGMDLGFMAWILAVIGGAVGALLFARFLDWGLIILASLVGSLLVVRGVIDNLLPSLTGPLGTVVVVALTAAGIFYHYRQRYPASAAPAKT